MKQPKLYAFNKKLAIDLSLSENPLGCSPRVFNVLRRAVEDVTSYPDPTSQKLRTALAKKFGVPKDNITVGNGSESLIDLTCQALIRTGDEGIIPMVTFPFFEVTIYVAGGRPVFAKMSDKLDISLDSIEGAITKNTKLILLCNPNNPTGKILSREDIVDFAKQVSPIPVVVDEANIEFGGESVVSDINNLKNLIVLRTFSKAFGLAGLRIGVLLANERLIRKINQRKQSFPLNTFAEKAALAALKDEDFISKSKLFMDGQRAFLTQELQKRNFDVFDSQANNILVKAPTFSKEKFVKLLNENGVSVVNGSSFRGLSDQFFRVSPRLAETNRKFLNVIDKIIKGR